MHSPAQDALVLVFSRSVESENERRNRSISSEGSKVTVKLLVASDLVGCLSGSEGKVIAELREVSGANIQILGEEQDADIVPGTVVVQVKYIFISLFVLTQVIV